MQITLADSKDRWPKNDAFSIATYNVDRDRKNLGPVVNIRISHEVWRQKTNKVALDGLLDYLIRHAENFIQARIKTGEIQFSDKPSPILEPKHFVIASREYILQQGEILISTEQFEKS
ncbi:MAG: hypothetical protein WC843_04190 [Candidatus Gracilibacteria bacterium]|jgi:hypothetical protein